METAPITYETSYKWTLSLGTFLLLFSISVPFFKEVTTKIFILEIILLAVAALLINSSLAEMKKTEGAIRRYNQELTVSEIIKQDLLLMEKEKNEIEYNHQIIKWNKENVRNQKNYKKFRKIDLIIKQALDPYFYEKYLKEQGRGEKW